VKHATHGPKAVDEAVVERAPGESQDAERVPAAVIPRLRQQELLAELGVLALKGTPFQELLDHTARLSAEGLQAEFCKVMEHLPAENRLLVRAGVGWEPGIVGTATIGADLDSPGGFALRTGKPVISNHLENEERFRTPELLLEHGIRRAMNVILQGDGTPFGVLEVDSRSEGEFGEHDIAFLQGAANLLGMAIERQRIERNLRAAIGERDILLQEMSHRIKNSLQLVASMLHLQSGGTQDEAVRYQLAAASSRIAAVARAHHRLYQSSDIRTLDLSAYLRDLCADLDASVAHCRIEVEAPERVEAATDRAVPIALVVNELVANAAKYAYPEGSPCRVRVRLARADEPASICLSVQDDGVGLPAGFDANAGRGLGMRIVTAFAQQLGADLRIRGRRPGTEFMLVLRTSALGTSPRA
jgi:two-component sensor histidine kinase